MYSFDINNLEQTLCDTNFLSYFKLETGQQTVYFKPPNLLGDCTLKFSVTNPLNIKRVQIKVGSNIWYDFKIENEFKYYPFFVIAEKFSKLEFIVELKDKTDFVLPTLQIVTGLLKQKDIDKIKYKFSKFEEIQSPEEKKKSFFSNWFM